MVGATATQHALAPVRPLIRPGPIHVVTRKIVAHRDRGPQQWRPARRVHVPLQPVEEAVLVGSLETAHAALHHARVTAIDGGGALVDAPIAHAHVAAHLACEGLADRPHGQQVAEAMVLVPVGKVLVFLLLRAGPHTVGRLHAVRALVGIDLEGGSLRNGNACVVPDVVEQPLPLPRRDALTRESFTVLEEEICGWFDGVDTGILFTGIVPPPGSPHADLVVIRPQPVGAAQVHCHRAVPVEIVRGLGAGLGLTRAVGFHPRQVQNPRVVVKQVHVRRTAACGQRIILRRQRPLHLVGPHLGRLTRVDGVQLEIDLRIRQVIEQHRARVIQREHHVGLDRRRIGDDQRVLGHLRMRQHTGRTRQHRQGKPHPLRQACSRPHPMPFPGNAPNSILFIHLHGSPHGP